MALSYDDAVAELYRSPHDAFVAERKRLAQALKAGGDKAGAARFAKLGRPPISAWAVNQLWWQERDAFEQLFTVAARLRAGDQGAAGARRDTLAALKARAASVLVQAGHAANEATLRRVTTTLAALAAAGSFEPDAPGALPADRDPPGFELAGAFGGVELPSASAAPAPVPSAPQPPERAGDERRRLELVRERAAAVHGATAREATPVQPVAVEASVAQERERSEHERAEVKRLEQENLERERTERQRLERERAERERVERERVEREQAAEAERRREEAERAARRAERARLQESLPALRADFERRQREVERLRAELERVERLAEQARTAIVQADARLDVLGAAD